MKCDFCSYEFTLRETQEGAECPQCAAAREKQQRELAARQGASAVVRAAEFDYPGAQPVVVVDIKMGFWSMVIFMVKWAIAAIPALLIIALICIAVFSFIGGFIGGISKYATAPAVPKISPAAVKQATPERISTQSAKAEFWLLDLEHAGYLTKMVVRTDNQDGDSVYSEFSVDCANALGFITRTGSSIQALQPKADSRGFESIQAGTPRHDIAKRGCRDRPDKNITFQ